MRFSAAHLMNSSTAWLSKLPQLSWAYPADGFEAKPGCFCQRVSIIIALLVPSFAPSLRIGRRFSSRSYRSALRLPCCWLPGVKSPLWPGTLKSRLLALMLLMGTASRHLLNQPAIWDIQPFTLEIVACWWKLVDFAWETGIFSRSLSNYYSCRISPRWKLWISNNSGQGLVPEPSQQAAVWQEYLVGQR